MGRIGVRGSFALGLVFVLVSACKDEEFEGGDPADVAGQYTVAITNGPAESSGAASCPLGTWVEGEMSTGIVFTVMQNGSAIQGQIEGATGLALWAVLGTAAFSGSVSGNDLHIVIFGTKTYMEGSCTYTFDATTDATLDGDTISGTTVYAPVLGTDPACDGIVCTASQRFSGSRPPR